MDGSLPMNIKFDPAQPWVGVMTYAARDGEYWARHVIRPAQTFLARGGSGKRLSKETALSMTVDKETQELTKAAVTHREPGQGLSRNARKRRAAKSASEASGGKPSAKSKPGQTHPKKFGQLYVTSPEGHELCYERCHWCVRGALP